VQFFQHEWKTIYYPSHNFFLLAPVTNDDLLKCMFLTLWILFTKNPL